MICSTEFDLLEAGFRGWPFALAPLLFVIIGAALFFRSNQISQRLSSLIFTLGALAVLVFFVWSTYGPYRSLLGHYKAGNYTIVEGRVSNFYEQGAGAQRVEFMTIHNREFKMSGPAIGTIGYNKRSTEGGVLTDKRYVKIWHVNGQIVRLETCV